ncbi:MAG: GMC family oxidoreductase [Bryobacteraceae bacterium]
MSDCAAVYSNEDVVDAVVVGTGAGGAPVLARLAAAGLSAVALEAGRQWNPPEEYASDEVSQRELFWLDERLSGGADPIAFGGNNSGCGVGGSTLHYGAFAPRAQPRDFRLRSEFGPGEDWPLSFQDLAPYYSEVEKFIGVSGPANYPWGPDAVCRYPLPPLPLNAPAQLMQRGCEQLGIQTAASPTAVLSNPYLQRGYGSRPACINCGFCHQGCINGAKGSMDRTYLPAALQSGAEIRPDCFVHGFETNGRGLISGVLYWNEGKEMRQRCRTVFLCAGAIETPRLLLYQGLANSSGQVGRNFMAHVATQVWGQFEEETRPHKGFPASLVSEENLRPKSADFAGGYLLQSLGIVPVTWAAQVAQGRGLWGQALRDHLRRYNHSAGIGVNGDCLPSAENYLELSEERDGRGLLKPRIYFTQGLNERRMRDHAAKVMRDIWSAAGASDVWTFERTAHTIGTCRMGVDASSAVVNSYGQSFDVPNLWISDNSTFPSALAANPALTIMALGLRTADHFLAAH